MRWLLVGLLVVTGAAVWLRIARARELARLEVLAATLAGTGPAAVERFDPAMVEALPPPARRFLLHTIAPGTPLAHSVRLRMEGRMRLRPDAEPVPMRAEQVLATPRGLVWRAWVGSGVMRVDGFDAAADGEARMRWWLLGLVPVVRAGGEDVTRSAAGRIAGEAIWLPSALLPRRGAVWEPLDDGRARVSLDVGGETVTLTLTVGADGRLSRVELPRWDANGPGPAAWSTFVADEFEDEATFGGYTLARRARIGWRLGEPDEFPFFFPVLLDARFDPAPQR